MTSSNRSDGVYRLNDEDVAQDVNDEFDFENDGEDADEGEEKIDSDAVDPVKLNPGSVSRRNVKPITPKSKNSPIWSHFKVYPNLPAMSADSKQNMWHEFAVCVHCYEKYHTNKSILSSTIWEVKYGTSHSTSKLSAHLQRKHKSAYRSNVNHLEYKI